MWFLLWLAALSLNSVVATIHTEHGHNICAHGEITHHDEGEGEDSAPQKTSQWASIDASHQHCLTSPWSRTLCRMGSSPLETIHALHITQFVRAPVVSIAFRNIALTHQAPKNSPPFIS